MEDSILNDIKRILGITPEEDGFDREIIMHINTVFMILNQLGVGPTSGFRIEDAGATWGEYLTDSTNLEAVKTYIGMKVMQIFDPPSGTSAMEAVKNCCAELEWRLNVEVDTPKEVEDESSDE